MFFIRISGIANGDWSIDLIWLSTNEYVFGALISGKNVIMGALLGFSVAILGLISLIKLSMAAPSPVFALIMGLEGCVWAGLLDISESTFRERFESNCIKFFYACGFSILLSVLVYQYSSWSITGVTLAVPSGAIGLCSRIRCLVFYVSVD